MVCCCVTRNINFSNPLKPGITNIIVAGELGHDWFKWWFVTYAVRHSSRSNIRSKLTKASIPIFCVNHPRRCRYKTVAVLFRSLCSINFDYRSHKRNFGHRYIILWHLYESHHADPNSPLTLDHELTLKPFSAELLLSPANPSPKTWIWCL